jgi:hypothetical protein
MLAGEGLAPRPKVDPRKAGVESDEDEADNAEKAEKAAEDDAYVVSEAGDSQNTDAGQSTLKKTAKTSERPVLTTAPASAAPQRTTTTTNKSAPEQKSNGVERPRRVSDRP